MRRLYCTQWLLTTYFFTHNTKTKSTIQLTSRYMRSFSKKVLLWMERIPLRTPWISETRHTNHTTVVNNNSTRVLTTTILATMGTQQRIKVHQAFLRSPRNTPFHVRMRWKTPAKKIVEQNNIEYDNRSEFSIITGTRAKLSAAIFLLDHPTLTTSNRLQSDPDCMSLQPFDENHQECRNTGNAYIISATHWWGGLDSDSTPSITIKKQNRTRYMQYAACLVLQAKTHWRRTTRAS